MLDRFERLSVGVLLLGACSPPDHEPSASERRDDGTTVRAELAYVDGGDRERQSLDLWMPADAPAPPPLVAFVHGGFWTLADGESGYSFGPGIAEALTARGVAVALVRYRLAPEHEHPAAVRDVAAATAWLAREAENHGYDAERLYLLGHSAGGHLAALLALDASWLGAHDLTPDVLAGVASVSGIYDVTPPIPTHVAAFGTALPQRAEASPATHVRADAPPFLLVAGSKDIPGFAHAAKLFRSKLRKAGHESVELHVLPDQDHYSLLTFLDAGRPVADLLLGWMNGEELPATRAAVPGAGAQEMRRTWNELDWSGPYWEHRDLITTHPVDERFHEAVDLFFGAELWREREEFAELVAAEEYHALDLLDWLEATADGRGRGNYLEVMNIRNERLFWHRDDLEAHRPQLVIGIGEQRELFAEILQYRTQMEYSWREDLPQPPHLARPLGAFIHFPEGAPDSLLPQMTAPYSLAPWGFRWLEEDPLAPIRGLSKELFEVVTWRNGCVYCHELSGITSKSHHNTARSAKPTGGFALPLADYPPDAWERFVFRHWEAAEAIGVSENTIQNKDAARQLYEFVVREREAR